MSIQFPAPMGHGSRYFLGQLAVFPTTGISTPLQIGGNGQFSTGAGVLSLTVVNSSVNNGDVSNFNINAGNTSGVISVGNQNQTATLGGAPSGVALNIYTNSNAAMNFGINGVYYGGITTSGNWNFGAPGGGVAGNFFGAPNSYTTYISGSTVSNGSYGLLIQAGTSSADQGLAIVNSANTAQLMSVRGDGSFFIGNDGSVLSLQGDNAGNLSTFDQANNGPYTLGYRDMPVNAIGTNNYTLALSDRGKAVQLNINSTTLNIPSNVFPNGTTILVISANTTDTISTSDTLTWLPSGTASGTRTLNAWGFATLYKNGANSWLIWGSNIS